MRVPLSGGCRCTWRSLLRQKRVHAPWVRPSFLRGPEVITGPAGAAEIVTRSAAPGREVVGMVLRWLRSLRLPTRLPSGAPPGQKQAFVLCFPGSGPSFFASLRAARRAGREVFGRGGRHWPPHSKLRSRAACATLGRRLDAEDRCRGCGRDRAARRRSSYTPGLTPAPQNISGTCMSFSTGWPCVVLFEPHIQIQPGRRAMSTSPERSERKEARISCFDARCTRVGRRASPCSSRRRRRRGASSRARRRAARASRVRGRGAARATRGQFSQRPGSSKK